MSSVAHYSNRIQEILSSSDPETISAKAVRRQLEREYGIDLTPVKGEVDELTRQLFHNSQNAGVVGSAAATSAPFTGAAAVTAAAAAAAAGGHYIPGVTDHYGAAGQPGIVRPPQQGSHIAGLPGANGSDATTATGMLQLGWPGQDPSQAMMYGAAAAGAGAGSGAYQGDGSHYPHTMQQFAQGYPSQYLPHMGYQNQVPAFPFTSSIPPSASMGIVPGAVGHSGASSGEWGADTSISPDVLTQGTGATATKAPAEGKKSKKGAGGKSKNADSAAAAAAGASEGSGGASSKQDAQGKKKRKTQSAFLENGDPRPKRVTPLTVPWIVSDTLSDLIGTRICSRTDVTKRVWAHIRANNLQNPNDKREIYCDPKMEAVTGVKQTNMHQLNVFLKDHFIRKAETEDMPPGITIPPLGSGSNVPAGAATTVDTILSATTTGSAPVTSPTLTSPPGSATTTQPGGSSVKVENNGSSLAMQNPLALAVAAAAAAAAATSGSADAGLPVSPTDQLFSFDSIAQTADSSRVPQIQQKAKDQHAGDGDDDEDGAVDDDDDDDGDGGQH
ncbi:hypothetical protein GQ42DRAFT_162067 [Ramicandelaber brevisporus]|nr:hypothetical protein GQ42DRAFT_162067 [Ramicandelaber brevisporus]